MNKLFDAKIVNQNEVILEEPYVLAPDIEQALQKAENWAYGKYLDDDPRVIEIREIYKSVVE